MKNSIVYIVLLSSIFSVSQLVGQATCNGNQLQFVTHSNGTQHAKVSITSSATITSGSNVHLKAGSTITLSAGFEAQAGSSFTASIESCKDAPTEVIACATPDAAIWDTPWVSCQSKANPNTARNDSHWIRYDFGQPYKLSQMHVWNVNKTGESDKGFRQVLIDYSLNGSTWTTLGAFNFEQGTEEAIYQGFEAADFGGITARYVLLTSLSNWGHSTCSGISDVKFNIAPALWQDAAVALRTARLLPTFKQPNKNNGASSFLIYPNPARAYTNIYVESKQVDQEELEIVDITGKVITNISIPVQKGSNSWSLSLEAIPSGTYFVRKTAYASSEQTPQKLVVVNE